MSALRLASWIDRRRWTILVAVVVVLLAAGWVASRLPIYTGFSHLLPPNAPSVVHVHELETRIQSLGSITIIVESGDPALRDRGADALYARLRAIDPSLIATIVFDNDETRAWVWDNRFLFAPLEDLLAARDALAERVRRVKLRSNPLYVDLENEPEPDDDARTRKLRDKLKEAEAQHNAPSGIISADKRLRLLVVRTTFDSSDISRAGTLVDDIDAAAAATEKEVPGVTVAAVGDVQSSLDEHRALLRGMLISIVVTIVVVAAGLLLYYRSLRSVSLLMFALTVGTVATFAVTKLTIGHLNLASGFLSSIIVGNGINFGIVLIARHLEERRRGNAGVPAIAAAMSGTVRGTLTAALTASIAYASLIFTDFRGFRHFGIIGGIGMVLCWVTAYLVIPAGLAVLERRKSYGPRPEPMIGRLLVRLQPKRLGPVVVATLLGMVVAAGVSWSYLAGDPFERNIAALRSDTGGSRQAVIRRISQAFGSDLSGGFVVAVRERAQATQVLATLRRVDEGKPLEQTLFRSLHGLDDVLPKDQAEKLAVLADIRRKIDELPLDSDERAQLDKLRPPDNLRPLGDADIPRELAWPFTEKDGTRGRIILAQQSDVYDTWRIDHLIAFADKVRALDLGEGVILGGSMFVFADLLRSLGGDGPKATVAATIGAFLVVALLVGLGRHGGVTLLCALGGTLWMIAWCSLVGLRVNFLDFIALPITIGIGIDYSVNIVARERLEGPGSALSALRTTGGAVALCSYTTIVGYASLLLSVSGGIRSFGLAATIGELTSLGTAVTLAPALLVIFGRRADRRVAKHVVGGDGRTRSSS